jgi:hypothetical protein
MLRFVVCGFDENKPVGTLLNSFSFKVRSAAWSDLEECMISMAA